MQILWSAVLLAAAVAATPVEQVIEARTRAYDANFQNDAAGLRKAAGDLDRLSKIPTVASMALYYAAWAEWALAGSEMQAGQTADAIRTAERSVVYSRRALQADENDVEVVTMLVNGLIAVAVLDRPRMSSLAPEIARLRRRALDQGPTNPRVVMMDAGMIFNNPPEHGGGREKGLTRWREAIELFEREARSTPADPLRPRWGLTLAYGWLADLHLAFDPPQRDEARRAADTALAQRPDFWYVKEKVLPRLAK